MPDGGTHIPRIAPRAQLELDAELTAVPAVRADHTAGNIDTLECSRRLRILLGLEGEWPRAVAYHGLELVDVTTFGVAEPVFLVGRFEWPAGA
jgi:hypothetical protein